MLRERESEGEEVDAPEVPHPPHPGPLGLLEQQLVVGSLLGQLEVPVVARLELVGVRAQVVLDVARHPGELLLGEVLDLVGEVVGRGAEVDGEGEGRERETAPEGGVEACGRGAEVSSCALVRAGRAGTHPLAGSARRGRRASRGRPSSRRGGRPGGQRRRGARRGAQSGRGATGLSAAWLA